MTDFGLTQDQVDRQFALGKAFFELPFDEKLKYRADLENGGYNGYKPLGLREVRPGIKDNIEVSPGKGGGGGRVCFTGWVV